MIGGAAMLVIDENNNIILTRGDTATLDIELTNESGEPYEMTANDRIIFSVRRLYGVGDVLIEKTSSTPVIELSTIDTKNLSFGSYKYDIYLYNSLTHNLDTFIADRTFTIGSEVHEFNE